MRILVTDGMDKTAMAQLREAGHEVVEQFYAPDALGAALREFDATDVTEIFAQCPDDAGLGLAIGNRLKKAAGFHVVEV